MGNLEYLNNIENLMKLTLSKYKTNTPSISREITKLEEAISNIDEEIYLEKLAAKYRLENIEKKIIALLFVLETNQKFKEEFMSTIGRKSGRDIDMPSNIRIGDVIEFFCERYEDKLDMRRYFSVGANLQKFCLIEIDYPFYNKPNVLNLELSLPYEIVNYIIGDRNDYYSVDRNIDIEQSVVSFDNVIIDNEVKYRIKEILNNYKEYCNNVNRYGFRDNTSPKVPLVFLFYGPSGTGKTMLAKAIANYMKKLIVNVNYSKVEKREDSIKKLFKKAHLMDAVVFIDECHDLLKQDWHENRMLLIEIEKNPVVLILATSNVENLDHAFNRRISFKLEFKVPDVEKREKTWEIHFPDKTILGNDVDFSFLAKRFIFCGGHIKNAVLTVFSRKSDGLTETRISQKDLIDACKFVEKQMLYPVYHSLPKYPEVSLSDLFLEKKEKDYANGIVSIIKGFKNTNKKLYVLFYGKEHKKLLNTCEGIAAELELPVHFIPLDVIYNEKSRFFYESKLIVSSHDSFLKKIYAELKKIESILVFVDKEKKLFSRLPDRGKGIDVLLRFLADLEKPVFVVTGDIPNLPSAASSYFDIIIKFDDHAGSSGKTCWQELWNNGVVINVDINPDILSEKYNLSAEEISETIRKVSMDYYFSRGEKKIELSDIENAVEKINKTKNTILLFGNI